jgi:hypothetical protein
VHRYTNHMSNAIHKFKVGDFVHYSPWTDVIPFVVTEVSPSGKTVRVKRLSFKRTERARAESGGIPGDAHPLSLDDVEVARDKDGKPITGACVETFRSIGGRPHSLGGRLLWPGFKAYTDPHL